MSRVATFGEALLVLRTSEAAVLAHESALAVGTGGAEANVAIGLARLGHAVRWLGRVGADGAGQRIARELRAEAIDAVVLVDPDRPTGAMLKEHPGLGRTRVSYLRTGSAGSALRPSDLDRLDLERSALLHLTGITPALSESARLAFEAAIDRAVAAGVEISFDVNHRALLWSADEASPVYRRAAAASSVLFAGIDEAALLLGREPAGPEEAARALHDLGPREVVVKLGAGGCLAFDGAELVLQPAVPVRVVDTVGAGDAVAAGYLAGRLSGLPLAERLRLAARVAAGVCGSPDDWEGFPTAAELDAAAVAGPGADPVSR